MNDSALAQDLYEKRYLMLRENAAENMFQDRSREFDLHLAELAETGAYKSGMTENISANHQKYSIAFPERGFLVKVGKGKEAEQLSANELKAAFTGSLPR